MNLFRSEEHARNWSGWDDATRGGLLSLEAMMTLFGAPHFRERLNGRYISTMAEMRPAFIETIGRVTNNDPFWALG